MGFLASGIEVTLSSSSKSAYSPEVWIEVRRVTAGILLLLSVVSPLIFVAMVWLTRAGSKRATAALVACISATVFSVCWDALAARMGWWSYPSSGDLVATLTQAITCAFVFGGAAGLAGWRIMRAMGWTGATTFFVGFVGIGLLRDYLLDTNTDLFSFGAGQMPQVMAAIGYLTMALVVQITMLLIAGPPRRDEMRTG